MYNYEKSRKYYYGKNKEFQNREQAYKHAVYKMKAMLEVTKAIAEPQIDDTGAALQVLIPIEECK